MRRAQFCGETHPERRVQGTGSQKQDVRRPPARVVVLTQGHDPAQSRHIRAAVSASPSTGSADVTRVKQSQVAARRGCGAASASRPAPGTRLSTRIFRSYASWFSGSFSSSSSSTASTSAAIRPFCSFQSRSTAPYPWFPRRQSPSSPPGSNCARRPAGRGRWRA